MANYSFNKTIIIGRLGQDPVFKSGAKTDTARFTLCNTTVKDGKEDVQWHNIVSFGKQANLVMEHLHKGDLVCIEGRLDSKAYDAKTGESKSVAIIAERMTFLSSKKRETKPESAECATA